LSYERNGKMNPRVSIIILNWNGWKDTIECLESLYQITYLNYDVIVVDNGSEDESFKKLKEYAEGKIEVESKFFEYDPSNKPIKFIEYGREEAEAGGGKEKEIIDWSSNKKMIFIKNEKNYGFAEGNNIGMRYALKAWNPDYVLLLNNDTVVDREFLRELVKVGEGDERIGIVGPMILSYYNENLILSAGLEIRRITHTTKMIGLGRKRDDTKYNIGKEVDYVSGCALLIKTEVIKSIGLMDYRYFVYVEEKDWCTRARLSGYSCVYVPQSRIWHKVSISANQISGLQEYYLARGQILYLKKFTNIWQSLVAFPIFFAQRILVALMVRKFVLLRACFRGLVDGLSGNFQRKWN
jgi:GT2 family glycosyltransferase